MRSSRPPTKKRHVTDFSIIYQRSLSVKANGRISASVATCTAPLRFAMMMRGILNSLMAWRHMPHGEHGPGVSATIAMAANSRYPSETALKMAVRSAQVVTG